jgi:hypothetical protein
MRRPLSAPVPHGFDKTANYRALAECDTHGKLIANAKRDISRQARAIQKGKRETRLVECREDCDHFELDH